MAHTLFQACLDTARVITTVVEGAATGGSVTTLIDTNFPFRRDGVNPPIDDFYNYGTLFLKTSTQIGISPACILVTDWTRSTKTITFGTLSKTITAADTYALIDRTYPLWQLRQAVNRAYEDIGGVETTDETLKTEDDEISYDLPAGVYNVLKVEVANETATPYTWRVHNNWRVVGTTIEFDSPLTEGYTIRLTYNSIPTELTSDSSTISDFVDPNLLKWLAATYILNARLDVVNDDEPVVKKSLVLALDRANKNYLKYRGKQQRTPKAHHFNVLGSF